MSDFLMLLILLKKKIPQCQEGSSRQYHWGSDIVTSVATAVPH